MLDAGQVDIWLTSLSEVDGARLQAYERLLSMAEHARWRRFVSKSAGLQHLVARALLRTSLSRYADVSPETWTFEANPWGRPYISQPAALQGLQFNLSHTEGLVACAIGNGCDIGIDVENIRRDVDVMELAPRLFDRDELPALAQAGPDVRRERFFANWTLKEAYLKARGRGLSLPLDGFGFDFASASPRIRFKEDLADDPDRWEFRAYAPTADHRLALAVSAQGGEISVCLRWVIPLNQNAVVAP